jgi:hypothetical protein
MLTGGEPLIYTLSIQATLYGVQRIIGSNSQNRHTDSKFTISLQQGDSELYDISRSPYTVERLILAQGLDAHSGRPDHSKWRRSIESDGPNKKRRQI